MNRSVHVYNTWTGLFLMDRSMHVYNTWTGLFLMDRSVHVYNMWIGVFLMNRSVLAYYIIYIHIGVLLYAFELFLFPNLFVFSIPLQSD